LYFYHARKKSLLRTFKGNTGLANQRETSYGLGKTITNKGTSKGRVRSFVKETVNRKGKI